MSLYNMLFGKNHQSNLLLAVVGLREHDVERFRDVSVSDDGAFVYIYSRTGGGNRDNYPNNHMRSLPGWINSEDDDFDSTYCTDTFAVPEEFIQDVVNLRDILVNGLRAEFGQHLIKTLRREPTKADLEQSASDTEEHKLRATQHVMANGHTFVPYNDRAMKVALELAEANGGELRSCFGILPLKLAVKQNNYPWPKATNERDRLYLERVVIDYEWKIDIEYWEHCKERFSDEFPVSMSKINDEVLDHIERDNARKPKAV